MFLRKAFNKKTGRTYLSIIHGYWDPVSKQSRTSTVRKIGYLDELIKEYPDPIAHFENVAAELDKQRKDSKSVTVSVDMDEQLERGGANRKNYGHVVFSKIYHELEIDRFLKNARRHENINIFISCLSRCCKKIHI